MMKLKLQLFALNTSNSIVDYLKSQGMDSSLTARKKLASNLGISDYSGTYDQNVQMLKKLQSGSSSAPKKLQGGSSSAPKSNTSNTNVAGSGNSSINGVDKATADKLNSSFAPSANVTNAQAEKDAYLGKVKELGSVTDIVDQSTWDAINKKFEAPSAYTEAMNLTNSLREKLTTGRTSYSDQLDAMISKIQNRDPFEYDVDQDMLFQQYLASSMASGKTAMQDTMGQAAALTGGYGSTYATSAANQQYNAYIQDAYNNLPEYYQMAMEAYQMEGEEMYNQLAMLSDADRNEYERMYNAWDVNNTNAQQIYDKSYGEWRDSINNAFNSANLQLNEFGQIYDQAYKAYTAVADNAQTMYQNEYTSWADEVNNAYKQASMLNSDYWNQKDSDYKYAALEQDDKHFNKSLEQENAQFLAKNDLNGDGVVDSKDLTTKSDGDTTYEFSDKQIQQLQNAYVNAKGGDAGEDAVLDLLETWGMSPSTEVQMNVIDNIVAGASMPETKWYDDPNWEKTGEGKGFLGKNKDSEDTYELNGSTYTYSQIEAMLEDEKLTEYQKSQILNRIKKLG